MNPSWHEGIIPLAGTLFIGGITVGSITSLFVDPEEYSWPDWTGMFAVISIIIGVLIFSGSFIVWMWS